MTSRVLARLEDVWMSYPRWTRGLAEKGMLARPWSWPGLLGDGPPVLKGVSLEVLPGQAVAVLGPNGAGKSTLLAVLAGLLRPRAGRVELNVRPCPLLENAAGLHPDQTGRENALMLYALLGGDPESLRPRLDVVAERSGLGEAFEHPVRTYSFGMSVRLSLSTALALRPELILLDDHALGDFRFREQRRLSFRMRRERGAALVMATHSPQIAAELCDEAVLLRGGKIEARGPVEEMLARYREAPEAAAEAHESD